MIPQSQMRMVKTQGLLGQQIQSELINTVTSTDNKSRKRSEYLWGLDEHNAKFIDYVKTDAAVRLYDLTEKMKIIKVLGVPEDKEAEYGIFDAIAVSPKIPMVIFNQGIQKIEGAKGSKGKIPVNVFYKIYHPQDNNSAHNKFLSVWKDKKRMDNINTIIMKVLVNDGRSPIRKGSYVDVVYKFGSGMFINLKTDKTLQDVDKVIEILRSHISAFTELSIPISAGPSMGIISYFVIDNLVVNSYIFRDILITKNLLSMGGSTSTGLFLNPFIWVNERGKSMTFRSHFKLRVTIGSINAKVIISNKMTKLKSIYYKNGFIKKFIPDKPYTLVTISNVADKESASVVKDLLSIPFFIYGLMIKVGTATGAVEMPYSQNVAEYYNNIIRRPGEAMQGTGPISATSGTRTTSSRNIISPFLEYPSEALTGSGFTPGSLVVSLKDLQKNRDGSAIKRIARLKVADPTFYGYSPIGKDGFEVVKQPLVLTGIEDANWQNVIADAIRNRGRDDKQNAVQIIRYPFLLVDRTGTPLASELQPKSIVSPYFLIATKERGLFDLKQRDKPEGRGSSWHPWIPTLRTTKSESGNKYIDIEGEDTDQEYYNNLINLNKPFRITIVNMKSQKSDGTYINKTARKLNDGVRGLIDDKLKMIFSTKIKIEGISEINFERIGIKRGNNDSLLRCILDFLPRDHPIKDMMIKSYNTSNNNNEFINITLRKMIVEKVNWNICRQELYDYEPEIAKQIFLDPKTPVDSYYYKSVLEEFFGIYLFVIMYNSDNKTYEIEIPRHKYFHMPRVYPMNARVVVVYKHLVDNTSINDFHYEPIKLQVKFQPNSGSSINNVGGNDNNAVVGSAVGVSSITVVDNIDWPFEPMHKLFMETNNTCSLTFMTIKRINETKETYETGTIINTGVDNKPSLESLFPVGIKLQYIDGAGKLRAIVVNTKGIDIIIISEPLAPLKDIDSIDNEKYISRNYLNPVDFNVAMDFIRTLNIRSENISYKPHVVEFLVVEGKAEIEKKRNEIIKKTADPVVDTKSINVVSTSGDVDSLAPSIDITGLLAVIENNKIKETNLIDIANIPSDRSVSRMTGLATISNEQQQRQEKLVSGIWFNYKGIQFYIPTTPGSPPEKIYAVNNISGFEVDPKIITFRRFDYYERVANILIQLIKILYLYSNVNDPRVFIDNMTVVDTNVVYDVTGISRKFTIHRSFTKDLFGFVKLYPSFFTQNEYSTTGKFPYLKFDSAKTRERMLYQLQRVQNLKENIIGASGSKFDIVYDQSNGIRKLIFQRRNDDGTYEASRDYLTEEDINVIPRMKEFFNRPNYIMAFYKYPSDFTPRGPDQKILMSPEEFDQHMNFAEMDKITNVIRAPLLDHHFSQMNPLYYVSNDGSLYILQNVNGGRRSAAINVLYMWSTDRVNPGYYSAEWDGSAKITSYNPGDIESIDPSEQIMLIKYAQDSYSALIKITGSISFKAN